MSTERRMGTEHSKTRKLLLDVTVQIMLEEGYAAATSRRVAEKAGVKSALLYYYFRTMDDLFIAVFRRGAEANLDRLRQCLTSPNPARAMWEVHNDAHGSALLTEFTALANHRKAIKAEVTAYARRFRDLQTEAFATLLARHGHSSTGHPSTTEHPPAISPDALAFFVSGIPQILALERALGLTDGHASVHHLIDGYLNHLDSPTPAPSAPASA